MQPNSEFAGLSKAFWANIRTISQHLGYTVRLSRQAGTKGQPGPIKIPTLSEIQDALTALSLTSQHLVSRNGKATNLGRRVINYYEYRANILNREVEKLLMNGDQAKELYEQLRGGLKSTATVPMNKQSGDMKRPAYFTGIINMIIDAQIGSLPCNYNPQELTTVTRNREPFRTLARRVDGAFPGPVDPVAVWEIKEYYYTTTFGSRVADGVYETLLDGMELEELEIALRKPNSKGEGTLRIQHLLMIDAHFTWWIKGRSYLCRIIDMLHMGYVDEVLFGREVVTRLPVIVQAWVHDYKQQS